MATCSQSGIRLGTDVSLDRFAINFVIASCTDCDVVYLDLALSMKARSLPLHVRSTSVNEQPGGSRDAYCSAYGMLYKWILKYRTEFGGIVPAGCVCVRVWYTN